METTMNLRKPLKQSNRLNRYNNTTPERLDKRPTTSKSRPGSASSAKVRDTRLTMVEKKRSAAQEVRRSREKLREEKVQKDKLETKKRIDVIKKRHVEKANHRKRELLFKREKEDKEKLENQIRLREKLEEERLWKLEMTEIKIKEEKEENQWRRMDFMNSVDFDKMCMKMRQEEDTDARRVTMDNLDHLKNYQKEDRFNRRKSMAIRRDDDRRIRNLRLNEILEEKEDFENEREESIEVEVELKESLKSNQLEKLEIEKSYKEMDREINKEFSNLQRERKMAEVYDGILANKELYFHQLELEETRRVNDEVPITKVGLLKEKSKQYFHTPLKKSSRKSSQRSTTTTTPIG